MTEPVAWKEERITEETADWQHFDFCKKMPEPHPYDMQKVKPLYTPTKIKEVIDKHIAQLESMKKEDCTLQEERQFQDIVEQLKLLGERFEASDQ